MQLHDCSQRYGRKWRGQIHSILWVWFVASIKRLKATGVAIQEEPQWGINTCNVNLQYVEELPGLRSPAVRSQLVESTLKKCAPDITRLLGGIALSRLALLNITVEGERPNSRRQWSWSSDDAGAPQQRRGSDSGLPAVLFVIFKARGWNMQGLGSEWQRLWRLQVQTRGSRLGSLYYANNNPIPLITLSPGNWRSSRPRAHLPGRFRCHSRRSRRRRRRRRSRE
jgi:hypothetical protein